MTEIPSYFHQVFATAKTAVYQSRGAEGKLRPHSVRCHEYEASNLCLDHIHHAWPPLRMTVKAPSDVNHVDDHTNGTESKHTDIKRPCNHLVLVIKSPPAMGPNFALKFSADKTILSMIALRPNSCSTFFLTSRFSKLLTKSMYSVKVLSASSVSPSLTVT